MQLILQHPEFVTATFYVRDASGNVMAVYKTSGTTNLTLEEQHIYGSSRLGIFKKDKTIKNKARALGERRYELTDHLGNVRVVLSDYKKAESIVLSATDYYPFGMVARTYTSPEEYRYGYNGKEKDPETDLYTTEFRQYDPRLAKWLSVDPRFHEMPWQSPYLAFDNKPIIRNDPQGDCPTCGAAVAGAVVGALMDMIIQVGAHMVDGHDMKTAISMINYADVMKEAAIGALAGASGFGATRYMKKAMQVINSPAGRAVAVFLAEQAVDMAVSQLAEWGYETSGMEASMYGVLGYSPLSSNQIGDIGEKATKAELAKKYKGQKVNIASQVTGEFQDGARTLFDFVVTDEKGNVLEVVESKTNTSTLTKNQRRFYQGG
jgi:RHS repeat-associated protein